MGMRERQILRGVEVPLASPVIIGGFRTAILQVIATATIGAVVGVRRARAGSSSTAGRKGIAGTGELIGGAILVAVLAIGVDLAARVHPAAARPARRPGAAARRRAVRARRVPAAAGARTRLSRTVAALIRADPSRVLDDEPGNMTRRDNSRRVPCPGASRSGTPGSTGMEETQCGLSARLPSGRRCWWRSPPARRVGAVLPSPTSGSARTASTSRSSSPRCTPRSSRRTGTRSPATSASARARCASRRSSSGQIDLVARVRRVRPRLLRQDHADRRRPDQPRGPREGPQGRRRITRVRDLARRGHERRRRPPGHRRPVQAHEDERPGRRPGQLKWGLPPDCDTNPLCKGALEAYGITYPPEQREALAACDAPIAEALNSKGVDFAWLCSTQPAIAQFGFVVLEDDKNTQPAENMAPIVRDDYLAKVGDAKAFQALLDEVSALLTTEELTELGVKVAVDQKAEADVAKAFLTENALLK